MNHLSTDLFPKLLKINQNFKNFISVPRFSIVVITTAMLFIGDAYSSGSSSSSSSFRPSTTTSAPSTFRPRTTTPTPSFRSSSTTAPRASTTNSGTSNFRPRTTNSTSSSFSSPSQISAPEPPPLSKSQAPATFAPRKSRNEFSGAGPGLKKVQNYRVTASKVKRIKEKVSINRTVKVQNVKGSFTYDNKSITSGAQELAFGKTLETQNSSASIYVSEYESNIQIRPNSKVVLFKNDHQIDLVQGSLLINKKKGRTLNLKSKNSKINIIDGESLTLFKPLLAETEIIVFDGKTQINNLGDQSDKSLVEQGQWAGIGGRYTSSIGDTVDLPPRFLNKYKKALSK